MNLKALNQRVADAKAKVDKTVTEVKSLEANDNRTDAQEQALKAAVARLDTELADAETAVADRDKAREKLDRDRRLASLGSAVSHGSGSRVIVLSNEPDPAQTYGFRDVGEFALAVRAVAGGGSMDERLNAAIAAAANQNAAADNYHKGDSTNDGYLLPPMFRQGIWELVEEIPDIVTMVDSEPTSARSVEVLADESTPWSAGGIDVRWEREGRPMTASQAQKPDPRQIPLHRLYAFVNATEDLLEDAPRLASRLTTKAATAIRWKIGNSLIYGDGVGKPQGWMNSPAKITVDKKSGQAANTIVVENIINMYIRLLVQPADSPIWIANRDILPQLIGLTIGDNPVWLPPQGLVTAPEGSILGYPVRWMEYAQTLGTEGDLQLVSPKGYYCPIRQGGVRMDTSIHLYFDQGLQSFRWTFRLGGQTHLSAPRSPANGATTRSHFVTLQTRA